MPTPSRRTRVAGVRVAGRRAARRPRCARRLAALGLGLALLVGACGGSGGGDGAEGGPSGAGAPTSDGQRLAIQRGCAGCHTANGRPSVGPTWKDIVGTTVALEDGSTVTVDRAYLERSIREPSAQVVAGFAVPMPSIRLADHEVAALVDYIGTLS